MAMGQDAEETKKWDRFWSSGKIEDYLRYKNCQESRIDCGQENRKFLEKQDSFS